MIQTIISKLSLTTCLQTLLTKNRQEARIGLYKLFQTQEQRRFYVIKISYWLERNAARKSL